MASINDLATAATIASSAVALQSSPTQPTAQPTAPLSSPLPPAPKTPLASSASHTIPARRVVPPPDSVLAAPQISPKDPAQAQIPPLTPAPAVVRNGESGGGGTDVVGGAESAGAVAKKPAPVRGAFVVFEGMDRAGKTTQAKLLQLRCVEAGRRARFMRFPDRTTPIGQMIDAYLRGQTEIEDHVIHLLFTANRWEAAKTITQALAAGDTVICDRYYHSGIVYSAAKQNPSLSLSWAKAPEVGLPRPDMVLFLDLEESVARERGGWGGEVYEKGEMQRRVRDLFWGLSMGDLGSEGNGGKGPGFGAGIGGGGSGGGSSSAVRKRVAPVQLEVDKDGGKVGDTIRVGGGPVEENEFGQEEEDIAIVDADATVEELSDRVWECVVARLEAVDRGEYGDTVRIVR